MYGDRDFACNWIGGEHSSLAIPYAHQEAFRAAGYAPIMINDTQIGGQVRQYGNLSFSRVYQGIHPVSCLYPETNTALSLSWAYGTSLPAGDQLSDLYACDVQQRYRNGFTTIIRQP